jgi:glucose-6-phosphate dehydrogenase assembly protein OpcA
MGVIGEIERELNQLRWQGAEDGRPDLRTSVMTHVVWAPREWLEVAHRTLEGLAERHPSRTIFLVPEPDAPPGIEHTVSIRCFALELLPHDICYEVIDLRLRGGKHRHPGSIVLPLLLPDLAAFCRWRGEPEWDEPHFDELVEVCDRLVVDSGEWPTVPACYPRLAEAFERIAISDIAWLRTEPWRFQLAELWPGIAAVERLSVRGPQADAHLLAGWLRSRLGRAELELEVDEAATVEAVAVDGEQVEPPHDPAPSASDLLSAELELFTRDPVYEAAVRAA